MLRNYSRTYPFNFKLYLSEGKLAFFVVSNIQIHQITPLMKRIAFFCQALLLFALFSSCARNPVTGRRDFMLMSTEQEIAMGKQSDPDIIGFFGLYEDAALQRFITEKGQQMAAISHRPELPYEFKVVDSPVVNAFAVPGGFVYFTRGIMAHFNNEAEFAGVLGHEIGHITARHSARQYSRTMLAQLGLIVGMVVAPQLAQFGEAAQAGVSLLFLKFGRDAERQSDKLGVEYSTKIGYDANEMAGFFRTLDRLSGGAEGERVPDFLSTHPNPQDRLTHVAKLAADWKKSLNLTNPQVNRNSYLRMIDGIVYGEDPKQGYVDNNVFYHPVLKFEYPIPANWTLQNTSQQVQMAPPDGKALLVLSLARGESLQAAAQALLEQYQLTALESRNENVNGLPALAIVADQQPQQPEQQQPRQGQQQPVVRTLIYLIQYGGNIYNFIGASSSTDFTNYLPVFTNTMRNFRELTDPARINVQPDRVRIKTVPQTGTLAQVLRNLRMPDNRLEELAVLNARIEQGMLIKVIEK
jgi:predicted Zn-dependent protease